MLMTNALMGLVAAFLAERDLDLRPRPLGCLALNIYHEARGEDRRSQEAVAFVTLNRAEDDAFPDRICEVVTDGSSRGCQFSWWCDGRSDQPKEAGAFLRALGTAAAVMGGDAEDPTDGALYFLRHDLKPGWTRGLRETVRLGGHRFLVP